MLDYVCNWYMLASNYIKNSRIEVAFVSTNSIGQGEQASILWQALLGSITINFAHRTFAWKSEARGAAHVHVVIIGFALFGRETKWLYEYDDISGDPQRVVAENINPYLVDGPNVLVVNRSTPLCNVPRMRYGNKPTDGGHLILSDAEHAEFLEAYPESKPFIRPLISAHEYLHGKRRWCLWLVDADPHKIRSIPGIRERVEKVRDFRLGSKAASTREYAKRPAIFRQLAQPETDYIIVPRHSSENRLYIPFGFFSAIHIVHDSCSCIPDAGLYHFGVISASMHMAWVKHTCGRIKSDFRYTKDIVYNNFPWPEAPSAAKRAKVEACAQAVLDARAPYLEGGSTLADLYDPLSMPANLLNAHHALDRAVDKCYRPQPFTTERERVEFLFQRYEQLTAPLAPATPSRRRRAGRHPTS